MKVTMAEINRKGNKIINRVVETGEPAVIMKHGQAIAEIRPLPVANEREIALAYIAALEPVAVTTPLEEVISDGRRHGL